LSHNLTKSIFTPTNISPYFDTRKLSSRSTIHAGRYLYDKEFCYLGTVNVTADVDPELLRDTGHVPALTNKKTSPKP